MADAAPAWLESVSIIRAGAGSSLAARTSAVPVLVAATSTDARTVVIELVGIVAKRREMAVTDSAGMISRIAIDASGPAEGSTVTRIRILLARDFRHRVRTSGNIVYIDFERAEVLGTLAARHRPFEPNTIPSASGTRTSNLRAPGSPGPPAARDASAAEEPPHALHNDVSRLSRWLSIAEPLQHTFEPPSQATVLGRMWIPIVLKDGATIFSYGDYAVVDDHVAFFLPFDDSDAPRVEAVTVPTSAVDRDATTRAAESVRAARYALTRGPREFADLSDGVSAVLNAIPLEADPAARVRLAESVRRRLIEWPAAHHGYRARDIHEAISTLDPILNQLRAAAGVNRVELSLAALTDASPPTITFRQPTLIDLLENAMRFVLFLAPSQRTAVLRATADSMDRHRAAVPGVWFATGQRRVAAALKSEIRADAAYHKLTTRIIERAVRAARDGNVREIVSLQSELRAADHDLGGLRKDLVASTMTALQTQFDLAAREQLHRERRALESSPGLPSRP
jgi:hypothetical protein